MKEYSAQRKHAKAVTRKKKVTAKKELKKRLTKKRVEQALQNMDAVELKRRIAIQDWLVEKWYEPQALKDTDKWKASFLKDGEEYKLEKLNFNQAMKDTLQNDLSKFAGLYAIVEKILEKKWIVFQVSYDPESKKFSITSLTERTWNEES